MDEAPPLGPRDVLPGPQKKGLREPEINITTSVEKIICELKEKDTETRSENDLFGIIYGMICQETMIWNVEDPHKMNRLLNSCELCFRIHDRLDEIVTNKATIKDVLNILINIFIESIDEVLQQKRDENDRGIAKIEPAYPKEPSEGVDEEEIRKNRESYNKFATLAKLSLLPYGALPDISDSNSGDDSVRRIAQIIIRDIIESQDIRMKTDNNIYESLKKITNGLTKTEIEKLITHIYHQSTHHTRPETTYAAAAQTPQDYAVEKQQRNIDVLIFLKSIAHAQPIAPAGSLGSNANFTAKLTIIERLLDQLQ